MTTLTATDPRVVDFYNHYHKKVLSSPMLYVSGVDNINVILPKGLLDYANAAAGHTGFGSGARARGIRKQVTNSSTELFKIFSSTSNLAEFLNNSEKNASEYVEKIKARHLQSVRAQRTKKSITITITDDRKAEKVWDELWEKYDLKKISQKFGKEAVLTARKFLTVNEFELRFGL